MIENNNFDRVDNFQQQVSQVDYPLIDNFLKNGFSDDIKIVIEDIFNDDSDLKDSFESFLKQSSLKEKMVCKQHLKDAKDQEEIKSIIMEQVPGILSGDTFYSSINDITRVVDNKIEEGQGNREEEQGNREEEQGNREEEQGNREEEQGNKEEEQGNKEEEQENTQQMDDTINKNKESETVKNIVASMADAKEKLYNLLKDNYSLQNNISEGTGEYSKNKEKLEKEGVLNQLRGLGLGDNFVRDYIQIYTAIDLINNDDEYQTLRESQDFSLFYIAMKNLNNACNIPDTSFDSFKENNIANTRAELFHETIGNKGLIEQRQKNIESHRSDYERLFTVESDDELIQKYGRFLDAEGKTLYEQWERDSSSISLGDLDMLMNSVRSKQEEIESKTKNVVEELCMVSQIKGFLGCIPREYSGQFQFNKANEISMNEDGVLQLNGHIKGVDFSLKQDTSDANARLQTSTMLYRDQDHNLNFTGKYKDSPFILPTASQVFDTALLSLKDDDLSNIQDQDDYFDRLENSILKNMDKLFAGTEYAHHYVESQIKSEEVIHETMQIFHLIGGGNIENLSNIRNEKLYNFFDTIEFNLSVMTNKEKEKFMECLGMLGKQIIEGGNIQGSDDFVKDEQLASFLGSKNSTMKILRGMGGGDNTLSFFDVFNLFFCQDERNETGNRKMINLYEFYDAINGDSGGCLIAMGRYEDMKGSDADAFLEEQIQMC